MKRVAAIVWPVMLLLVLVAAWEGAVRVFELPRYVLPAPSRIAVAFASHFPSLLHHASVTLAEIVLGLAIGGVTGFALAIAVFYSRDLE